MSPLFSLAVSVLSKKFMGEKDLHRKGSSPFGSAAWRTEPGEQEWVVYCITFTSHSISDLEVAAGGGSVVSCVGKGSVWEQPSVGDSLGHVQTLSRACRRRVLHFSSGTRRRKVQNAQVANRLSQYQVHSPPDTREDRGSFQVHVGGKWKKKENV